MHHQVAEFSRLAAEVRRVPGPSHYKAWNAGIDRIRKSLMVRAWGGGVLGELGLWEGGMSGGRERAWRPGPRRGVGAAQGLTWLTI